jgi:ATP-dependent DNA helicase RecG
MNRLLQGDVGSGKTIVAAEAAVIAIEKRLPGGGARAHRNPGHAARLLLQTDSRQAGLRDRAAHRLVHRREKVQLKKLVAEGLAHVAIGTHALLEKDVEFQKLGLAIIDEQHRFGVLQRLGLVQKGVTPTCW